MINTYELDMAEMYIGFCCFTRSQISSDWACVVLSNNNPDSNVHVAHMGSYWVLSASGGPHVGPMKLAIREAITRINVNHDLWRHVASQGHDML